MKKKKLDHILSEMDDYIHAMKISRGREPSQILLNQQQFDLIQSASDGVGGKIQKNFGSTLYRGIPVRRTGNATCA